MTPWLSSLSGIVGVILGVLFKVLRDQGRQEKALEAIECLPAVKVSVAKLEQRFEDYMAMLNKSLERALRDWPTHQERDILMEKLAEHPKQLTLEEIDRLDCLLVQSMREEQNHERIFKMGMSRASLTWLKSKIESEHADA